MLFQKKSRQLLAQGTSHIFTLVEGDQLILVRLREHPLESFPRTLKPAFAQRFLILATQI